MPKVKITPVRCTRCLNTLRLRVCVGDGTDANQGKVVDFCSPDNKTPKTQVVNFDTPGRLQCYAIDDPTKRLYSSSELIFSPTIRSRSLGIIHLLREPNAPTRCELKLRCVVEQD